MLTDKQSLILCGVIALGFSACGIIGVLDNHAVIGLLIAGCLTFIINLFIVLRNQHKLDNDKEETDIQNDLEK